MNFFLQLSLVLSFTSLTVGSRMTHRSIFKTYCFNRDLSKGPKIKRGSDEAVVKLWIPHLRDHLYNCSEAAAHETAQEDHKFMFHCLKAFWNKCEGDYSSVKNCERNISFLCGSVSFQRQHSQACLRQTWYFRFSRCFRVNITFAYFHLQQIRTGQCLRSRMVLTGVGKAYLGKNPASRESWRWPFLPTQSLNKNMFKLHQPCIDKIAALDLPKMKHTISY